jgi:hypothetical protein
MRTYQDTVMSYITSAVTQTLVTVYENNFEPSYENMCLWAIETLCADIGLNFSDLNNEAIDRAFTQCQASS